MQNKVVVRVILFISLSIIINSCGILGIHFSVHNPKKPGTYPKETAQLLLLAQSSKLRNCYDVKHYNINLTIDPKNKFISGDVIMKAKAVDIIDTLQIDLYQNMKMNKIFLLKNGESKELNFSRKEGAVFVATNNNINVGEDFILKMVYEGNPLVAPKPPWRGGFVWKKDKEKNPWIGVACETEGASLWWPCKDDVSDEPDSANITLTVPKNLVAVSNGKLQKIKTSGENVSYSWNVSYPINNYNITIYVGNFQLLHDEYQSKVTGKTLQLNHYVLPKNYEKAKTHFQQVKNHIAFYEKIFGPYPWYNDGFKFIESPYAGMEHQSAIAYGNGYKNDFNGFDYIILHETAHEWWGNSVSAADLADGWIHEGFASYCEALYVESTQGKDAYLDYLFYQRIMILNKRPLVRKRNIRYFNYKDGDIYTKGSMLLHTLRCAIDNDTLFFDILKTFRMENNQKQILSEVFIDLVNKKTNADYNWFFKQYLFKREAPFFEYYMDEEHLYYRWVNTDNDFKLPVKIKVNKKTVELRPTTNVQRINFKDIDFFYYNSTFSYYGSNKNKKLKTIFNQNTLQ